MAENKRWWIILLATALMLCLIVTVSAQGATNGTLTFGQPSSGQISAGQTLRFDYPLAQTSTVTLQVLSDTAQPTITILRDGSPVASALNNQAQFTVSLTSLLDAGSYVVEVGSLNNTAGVIFWLYSHETPVTATPLTPGSPIGGGVSTDTPLAHLHL